MLPKILFVIASFSLISGCIATPRFEMSQAIDFQYMPGILQPMGFSDVMCCAQCSA
jgi:hypothetical protein